MKTALLFKKIMESIHIPCENQSAIKVEKIDLYSVVISGKRLKGVKLRAQRFINYT